MHSHQIADYLNPLVNYSFSDKEQPSKSIATDGSASLSKCFSYNFPWLRVSFVGSKDISLIPDWPFGNVRFPDHLGKPVVHV